MINVFSKRAYRRLFTAIILFTVASMALTGGIFILFRTRSTQSFMSINHHEVSHADFRRRVQAQERRIELLRLQFEQAGIPFDSRMLGIDVKQVAAQSLITDALLNEEANAPEYSLGLRLRSKQNHGSKLPVSGNGRLHSTIPTGPTRL